MDKLENFLTLYLVKKAPYTIPLNVRAKIVTFTPWIDLILVLTFLPVLVMLLGLNSMVYGFAYAYGTYGGWGLATIISLIPFVLEIFALPGLFKRKKYAWNLLMYSSLLIVIENVLFFSVGGILGGVIGLYILFQIKEYYK
ncbi:MAG: hypothetical protein WC897_00235 [Candidatus Gracilibacteria bacterium]